MSRNAISDESICMLRGPIGDKRVMDCQRGINKSEFTQYITDEANELGILIEDKNSVAVDAWYFEYSYPDSQDQIDRYRILYHFRVEREVQDYTGAQLMSYYQIKTDPIITFDDLQLATRNYEFVDTPSVISMFQLRPCNDSGPRYAKEKGISSFDTDYSNLYEQYVQKRNWYTQVKLFMYLLINGLALHRSEINEAIIPLNQVFLETFSDPSPIDGDRSELADNMEKLEVFAALIRSRILKSDF